MNDPRLALKLYVLIIIVAFMFSKRWSGTRAYLTKTTSAAKTKGMSNGSA